MGIDFDGLLLSVGQDTFGEDVTVYPIKSMPSQPAYQARGVYTSEAINVEMQDASVFSDQQTKLAIRESEFQVIPKIGDRVKLNKTGVVFWVSDSSRDGQGETVLQLRNTKPEGDTDG